jgi:hypothetical protein
LVYFAGGPFRSVLRTEHCALDRPDLFLSLSLPFTLTSSRPLYSTSSVYMIFLRIAFTTARFALYPIP